MDQSDHHYKNLHSWIQFQDKKVTKLLISLSFLSIFFFFSPWYSSLFLDYFNLYSSQFPFQFLSHSMDRNYMFLICNGILVLLVKTSGFNIRGVSVSDLNDALVLNKIEDNLHYSSSEIKPSLVIEKDEVLVETISSARAQESSTDVMEKEEEEEEDDQYLIGEESEDSKCEVEEEEEKKEVESVNGNTKQEREWFSTEEEEEEIGKELSGFIVEAEKEEDGNDDELLNTEELNKKFDEFIMRMKQEIRIQG